MKSPDFVLTEQDLHRGHVIHAHPTHGTKSYVLHYPRTLHLSNSRLFSPGSVPSPSYTSVGTNVTFQFPQISPAGSTPSRRGLSHTNTPMSLPRLPPSTHAA